jgi:hypothetical protein
MHLEDPMRRFVHGIGLLLLLAIVGLAPMGEVSAQGSPTATLLAVDGAGNLVPGACFSFVQPSGTPIPAISACDGDDGVEDGVTLLQSPFFSASTIVLDRAPEGFLAGASQAFDPQGGPVELTFTLEPGGQPLAVATVGPQGEVITGACVGVFQGAGRPDTYLARGCDSWDGAEDGQLAVSGLPAGDVLLGATTTPIGWYGFIFTEASITDTGDATRVTYTFEPAGGVSISFVDGAGAPVPGVCIGLQPTAEDTSGSSFSACAFDSMQPGVATAHQLPVGDYQLTLDQLPVGYDRPADVPLIEVRQGETATATVVLPTGGQGITVAVVDEAGTALTTFCVNAYPGTLAHAPFGMQPAASQCYGSAPIEPIVLWGLEPGPYSIFTDRVVAPYTQIEPVVVDVGEGQNPQVTVVHQVGATLTATALDDSGAPIPGMCFAGFVTGASGVEPVGFGCDGDLGDAPDDGIAPISDVPAGQEVAIVVAQTPGRAEGFVLPPAQVVRTDPGAAISLTFEITQGGVTAVVNRVDAQGTPLPGSCFTIFTGTDSQTLETLLGYACDGAVQDGVIEVAGLVPGTYTIVEMLASDGQPLVTEPVSFTVEPGTSPRITVGGAGGATPVATIASPAATATLPASTQEPQPTATTVATPTPTSPGDTGRSATVIAASANVRAEPSSTAAIVATLAAGDVVTVTGDPVDAGGFTWLPITTATGATGATGWITSQLIQLQ